MTSAMQGTRVPDLLADDFAARFPAVRGSVLGVELLELERQARAWFDPSDEETRDELARLERALAASSLVDLARPDTINLAVLRTVAQLPAEWDDAHVLAGVALVAVRTAADGLDDEAYALRYLAAGRDALRLAELVDAPRAHAAAQTEAAAAARRKHGLERLQDFVSAWRAAAPGKWEAKRDTVAALLSLSPERIEALHTEARKLGMID